MRIALHTGKGGVGKTTISAATAVACATNGVRTLLVSTDPAHSIADVLGVPVHGDPTPVSGVSNLWAAQVDTRGRFEQSWAHIRGYLVGVLAARGMAEVQAEELTVLPGAEEIVALLELRRLAESGDFDAIVVDCAPTGETLRLLALPETIGFYVQRLLGGPQRVLRTIAASLTGMPGGGPNATVRDALGDLLAELMAARALLADPAITGVRLVLTPERMVVAEARRLFTALSLHGFRVEAVTVNRVLPPDVGGDFLRRQREGQREALTQVEESFQGLPIRRVQLSPTEPIGVQNLCDLATDMFVAGEVGPIDPIATDSAPIGIAVSGSDGWYRLALPLPFTDRGDIALSRSGADLVVTVGDVRRRIALPSVLQRCSTEGASFEQGRLMIDFAADPALWPANLMAANVDQATKNSNGSTQTPTAMARSSMAAAEGSTPAAEGLTAAAEASRARNASAATRDSSVPSAAAQTPISRAPSAAAQTPISTAGTARRRARIDPGNAAPPSTAPPSTAPLNADLPAEATPARPPSVPRGEASVAPEDSAAATDAATEAQREMDQTVVAAATLVGAG